MPASKLDLRQSRRPAISAQCLFLCDLPRALHLLFNCRDRVAVGDAARDLSASPQTSVGFKSWW